MENIKKSTVSAKGQLEHNENITYVNPKGSGMRVMFVGNSLTRHGINHEMGCHNDCGKPESSQGNDYVHVMIKKLNEMNPDAAYCICQIADWESDYKNAANWLPQYCEARDFEADIIVMRIVEDCPCQNFDKKVFKSEYDKLLSYLNKTENAKVILTIGFWHHVADETIREYAIEKGFLLVELDDLGMEAIANRILPYIYDYKVKVNGKPVDLHTARVSAVPFNRRWPGHQRGLEQTELIHFLSLSADEPLEFEIETLKPYENVVVRPLSLGITPAISEDGVIRFTLDKHAYFTVEPYGRNHALHIFVDGVNDYGIDVYSDNVLYYGKGQHDVGTIALESNQVLFIDEGAVVYGCVRAIDAENIKILGKGILDNSKNKEKILFDYNAQNNEVAIENAIREHTIELEYCTNVEIDGITIRDSLLYNIRPIGCKNLSISNIKIIGCWRYNSDGIDMHNCENVLINHCFIRTFDDCICVKGFDCYYEGDVEQAVYDSMYRNGKAYDVFKNVHVTDCVLWNDWGKTLEIGAETRAEEICDVLFEDCDIIHMTMSPLDCNNIDYADVHDILYQNINVECDDIALQPAFQVSDDERYVNHQNYYACVLISVATDYHMEYSAGGTRRGKCRDILFKNIRLYGKYEPIFFFKGYDEAHMTKDIIIENVYWNDKLLPSIDKGNFLLKEYTDNIIYKTSVDI